MVCLRKKAGTSLITHREGMDFRLPSQLYHRSHVTVIEKSLGRDADVDPALRDAVSDAVSDTQIRTVNEAVERINEAQDQSHNNRREQGN